MVSPELVQIAVIAMVALAVGCVIFVLATALFSGDRKASKRLHHVAHQKEARKANLKAKESANRRRVVQDSLKELDEKAKNKKKRVTIRQLLDQAGFEVGEGSFYMVSAIVGLVLGVIAFLQSGNNIFIALAAAFVGGLGLPRWVLGFLRNRRFKKFLDAFPDAIDIVVRGVKSGLPLNDTIRMIAAEAPEPIRSEFREIVDGQALGLPIGDGLSRMYERIPLPEVNFLGIVVSIQAQAGGNLSEALSNLSRVLRDRKKLKGKVNAVSQEAKASAAIIGCLPLLVIGGMYWANPTYLNLLFTTQIGNIMIAGSIGWMLMGVLVMRKMINFEI